MKLRTSILVLASLVIVTLTMATPATADESAPALLAAGRADDAITNLRSKISTSPNNGEAYNLLCRAYFSMGDWDRGISACEKAVALEPNNSRYHMWLGRIYGEKADGVIFFKAASLAGKVRDEFEAAVRLDPKNVDARSDLGEFYLEAPGIVGGGRDKAEAQATALAALDPAKAHYINGRRENIEPPSRQVTVALSPGSISPCSTVTSNAGMPWKRRSTTQCRRNWIAPKFSWSRGKSCCAAGATSLPPCSFYAAIWH